MALRDIDDVLYFRQDLSPFLVHLTRENDDGDSASALLKTILTKKMLKCGDGLVSDARFGMRTYGMSDEDKQKFFSAICLTETPLSEVHCLLDISRRRVELEPYGLVFLKERLMNKHNISPVLYLNNSKRQADGVLQALCTLIKTKPKEAAKLIPLISIFGVKATAPGAAEQNGEVNFLWEREWRMPSSFGSMKFSKDDVFIGLCPHGEIGRFEKLFDPIGFIDPRRSMKWYASKLVEARQRLDIKYSVV